MARVNVGRIVILGNGFDMAHGLKSSYGDFIRYLILESINYNESIRNELLDVGFLDSEHQTYEYIKTNFGQLVNTGINTQGRSGKITFHNQFLLSLLKNYFEANWVDIEDYYFKELCKPNIRSEELNKDFEVIKTYLTKYLDEEFAKDAHQKIPEYLDIFSKDSPDYVLFLNFNHTSTINLYFDMLPIKKKEVVYIHGQLGKTENPIIFGYGDDTDPRYVDLVNSNIDSNLRNLKRPQYNIASSYSKLIRFLDYGYDIEVYCIGHSIGVSDKTLLKEVFDHEAVFKIKLFYHKDVEGYRKLNNNLSRIVSTKTLNKKVVHFPNSEEIPQKREHPR